MELTHERRGPPRQRQTRLRAQLQPRPPRADQQRGDHEVQPVERVGVQKLRQRARAALDQHARKSGALEGGQNVARIEPPLARLHLDRLDAGRRRRRAGRPHADPPRPVRVAVKHPQACGRAAARVDHDAGGIASGPPADRQLRIVRERRAHAHHHGLDLRPQPVQMVERAIAVDPPAFPGNRGDPPVEGLPELAKHKIAGRGQARGHRTAPLRPVGEESRNFLQAFADPAIETPFS